MRYHAARGLIYLGYLDVGGVYLFKRVPGTTEYKASESSSWNCLQDSFFPEISEDSFDGHAKYWYTLLIRSLCCYVHFLPLRNTHTFCCEKPHYCGAPWLKSDPTPFTVRFNTEIRATQTMQTNQMAELKQ